MDSLKKLLKQYNIKQKDAVVYEVKIVTPKYNLEWKRTGEKGESITFKKFAKQTAKQRGWK
jgi:hypothetical protein